MKMGGLKNINEWRFLVMEKEKIQHTQPTDTSVEVTTPPEGNKKKEV